MENKNSIIIKKGNAEISMTNISEHFLETKNFLELLKIFDLKCDDVKEDTENTENKKIIPIIRKNEERSLVKDRLPNTIDLSELEIKKAVTEEPMIRCSTCGQSNKAIIIINKDHNYYMQKRMVNNKESYITLLDMKDSDVDGMCKPSEASISDYTKDIDDLKVPKALKDVDINVDVNTEILCPICGAQDTFNNWAEAFKHPLEYGFETELLCDMCGQEAADIIQKDNKHVIRCESCGYKKITV